MSDAVNMVAQVSLAFWIMKICATTVGGQSLAEEEAPLRAERTLAEVAALRDEDRVDVLGLRELVEGKPATRISTVSPPSAPAAPRAAGSSPPCLR